MKFFEDWFSDNFGLIGAILLNVVIWSGLIVASIYWGQAK